MSLITVPALAVDPVSNLQVSEKGLNYITWTWTNPAVNYTLTEVWIDGVHVANTTGESYTATGLEPGTTHTISLRVWSDVEGVYSTWVNNTATTYTIWQFLGVEVIGGITNLMPGIGNLVIAIVPVVLLLITVGFLVGLFDSLLGAIGDTFKFLRR